ncbi:interphotoreceptor retinoid-binding protein [Rhodanobacter spathiphylli B39]|uniref:Interphotoreceptor retinoid-binding protein n=1 Tax=Rhodanobacter spathiphylli B39 TaxID=1163407 RepID=I4W3N5_9GAMM|nr:interphotoreceptor retinoid-binding protein [Rhodanobacter spathiphylli B39]
MLKNNQRATLIGEATGSGAHGGGPHWLTAHFVMFVPSGRPISPFTHTDWENIDVVPDVHSSAKKALDLAQVAALKGVIAGEKDEDRR